ncbi:MAG: hypothetical protein QXS20_05015 [Candidatus Thorarchaeota archaeon]
MVDGVSEIEKAWATLYGHNPKIQAFAVCRGSEVIWQTSNWDLVPVAEALVSAAKEATPSVTINGVSYRRITSTPEYYVSTADDGGNFLTFLVDGTTWLLAWSTPDSVPELTVVDLGRAAVSLIGKI